MLPFIYNSLKVFFGKLVNKNSYFGFYSDINDPKEWYKPSVPAQKSETPVITWIGHATLLIQVGNLNILTDPVFDHINPIACRRAFPPGVAFKDLPHIDAIIISHNHRDHLESSTIEKLAKQEKQPLVLAPNNTQKWFAKRGIKKENIHEFEWWQKITLNDQITLTFTPAKHSSGRFFIDHNSSGWGSWVIEHKESDIDAPNTTIYFAGDSGYADHFSQIGERFANIDYALIPIAPEKSADLLEKLNHLSTKQVYDAFCDLKADQLIPIHWATFSLGSETLLSPLASLAEHIDSVCPNDLEKLCILKIGEKVCGEK